MLLLPAATTRGVLLSCQQAQMYGGLQHHEKLHTLLQPSPSSPLYLSHTAPIDGAMYLSGFPSHSYLLLIHLSYVLNNNKKISYTRNRGHTGHSNWSWKWLLIKIWEEFMEITNCLWLNISSDRHTSMISRGQQLHFTGVFTALFLLFLCLFFPSKKKKKVRMFHFQKWNLHFPLPVASGCNSCGTRPGCSLPAAAPAS